MSVYPISLDGGINPFWVSQGFVLLNRAETSQGGSADTNLKRFKHQYFSTKILGQRFKHKDLSSKIELRDPLLPVAAVVSMAGLELNN